VTGLLLTLSAALGGDIVAPGLCDASAAVVTDGALLVTNDEDAWLYRYSLTGRPLGRALLGPDDAELDLEGAAAVGDRVWWVGSLGNNKRGEPRPDRSWLIATTPDGRELARFNLRDPLLASSDAGVPLAAAGLPPKGGGLNVEGLGASADGGLWLGLRSPLHASGRALLIPVDVASDAPRIGEAQTVDLGGRGVRSLLWWPAAEAWLVLAGATDGAADFALYIWPGAGHPPTPLPANLDGISPEGMLLLPSGELLLLSDDGSVDRDGRSCKKRWEDDPMDPAVYFRMRVVPLAP